MLSLYDFLFSEKFIIKQIYIFLKLRMVNPSKSFNQRELIWEDAPFHNTRFVYVELKTTWVGCLTIKFFEKTNTLEL